MTDEPMVGRLAEPLTDEELDEFRTHVELSSKRRMAVDSWRIRATIDALLSQLREQREMLEGDKDGCCQHYGHCQLLTPDGKCQVHEMMAEWHRKSDAAEAENAKLRDALERIDASGNALLARAALDRLGDYQ